MFLHLTGIFYFSSQSAAVLGPVLSGALVESQGSQYQWLWSFSAVFMVFAWFAMRGVKDKMKYGENLFLIMPSKVECREDCVEWGKVYLYNDTVLVKHVRVFIVSKHRRGHYAENNTFFFDNDYIYGLYS